MNNSRPLLVLSVLLCGSLLTGCSTLSIGKNIGKKAAQVDNAVESAAQAPRTAAATQAQAATPTRMAFIWKERTMPAPGKPTVQGFTGRIYFHDNQDRAMQANGELTIYSYDDSQPNASNVPSRKYVFPAEKFASHYSKSELGHSYVVWLPWGPVGGMRKSITLIPVFKSVDGKIIEGQPNRLSLTGRAPQQVTVEKSLVPRPGNQAVQENIASNNNRFNVDTIPVPQAIASRMYGVPENRQPQPDLQLAALDSQQVNPNGQLYNRVHYEQSVRHAPKGAEPTPSNPYGLHVPNAAQIPPTASTTSHVTPANFNAGPQQGFPVSPAATHAPLAPVATTPANVNRFGGGPYAQGQAQGQAQAQVQAPVEARAETPVPAQQAIPQGRVFGQPGNIR